MFPLPNAMATASARAIRMMAYTVDSRPELMPESTVVAGPVRAASAISRTGRVSVDVKYSVSRLNSWASTKPDTTAPKHFHPSLAWWLPTYVSATYSVPATVSTLAVRKPRLIGAMADLSLSVARTAKTPTIDASTPMARATTGKMRPSTGLAPID